MKRRAAAARADVPLGMSSGPADNLLAALAGDPCVFPHQYDPLADKILLVRLAAAALADHSFLDQRVLARDTVGGWFPATAIAAAIKDEAGAPPGVIFHVGHCGSTLLSRLLAEATTTRALREPMALRTLALDRAEGESGSLSDAARRDRLGLFLRLFGRGDQKVVVKATSLATALAPDLSAAARAIFLYQPPSAHLPLILSGPGSQLDLRAFSTPRHRRLRALGVDVAPLSALSIGEVAAMTWLAETASVVAASTPLPALEFGAFLVDPAKGLREAAQGLGLATTPEACRAAAASAAARRYSKDQSYPFGPDDRSRTIAQARRDHEAEISGGLRWLERLGARRPLVAATLQRFG